MVYPIIDSFRISLTNWNGISSEYDFVGFKNYIILLQDKYFWNAVLNTLFWVVMQLLIIALPTLVLSLMIRKVKVGMTFFRTGFYLPSIVSFSVAAVIWGKIYDPQIGPINSVLNALGLSFLAKSWLGDVSTVLPALVIASSWVQYGAYMVMYITGLQGIDPQYYEAAELDGANAFQKFWKITVPSLRNTINVVISLIIMVIPVVWTLFNVFKSNFDIMNNPFALPKSLDFSNIILACPAAYVFGAALISLIPSLVIYLLLQRSFVQGTTVGATKG